MRELLVIRIVHTPLDMGFMKDGLEKESVSRVIYLHRSASSRRIKLIATQFNPNDALVYSPGKERASIFPFNITPCISSLLNLLENLQNSRYPTDLLIL